MAEQGLAIAPQDRVTVSGSYNEGAMVEKSLYSVAAPTTPTTLP
jgi:hypothetical protein